MKWVNIKTAVKTHTLSSVLPGKSARKNVSRETIYGRKSSILFPVKQLRQMTNQVEYTDGVNHTLT